MFDTTIYSPTHKVNVNSVSGTLSKTCKDSFFKQCQIGSGMMDKLMSDTPMIHDSSGDKKEVVILQSMIIPDSRMLFELIWKEDFEKLED